MTISEFLEHVDRALPRGYRVNAVAQEPPRAQDTRRARISPGYIVIVEHKQTQTHQEFLVSREDLATDARGEWQATVIARTVKKLGQTMSERRLTNQMSACEKRADDGAGVHQDDQKNGL